MRSHRARTYSNALVLSIQWREREKKKNASKRKEEEKNLLVFLGSLWVVHDRAKRKLNK